MLMSLLLWRTRWLVYDARKKLYKNVGWLILVFGLTNFTDYNLWSERLSRIAGYGERNTNDFSIVILLYLMNIGSALLLKNGILGGEFRHFQESLPVKRRDAFFTDMFTIALVSLPVIAPFLLIVPLYPTNFVPRSALDTVNFVSVFVIISCHFCWGQYAYLNGSVSRFLLTALSLALIFSEFRDAGVKALVSVLSATVFLSETFYVKLAIADRAFWRGFRYCYNQKFLPKNTRYPSSWVLILGLLFRKTQVSTTMRLLLTLFFTTLSFIAVENSKERLQASLCYFFGVGFVVYIWSRCFSFVEKAHLNAAPFLKSLPINFDDFMSREKQKIRLVCLGMAAPILLAPVFRSHFSLSFIIFGVLSVLPLIYVLSKVNLERKATSTVVSFLSVCVWASLMAIATSR